MSASSTMDVDDAPNGNTPDKPLDIHPLALVFLSDHYTRIRCGGSLLPQDAPVRGLLFGNEKGEILDAEDVNVVSSQQQVELHQAVFPTHKVVGWYRVVAQDQNAWPTQEDVQMTKALQDQHQDVPLKFLLLSIPEDGKPKANKEEEDEGGFNLVLYSLQGTPSNVLVQESRPWQLATTEPERIAMERVVREQPQDDPHTATSEFATQLDSVQSSIVAMTERLDVIVKYLEQTPQERSSSRLHIQRQVQTLVHQLEALGLQDELVGSSEQPSLVCQLAAISKTVCAIEGYTEKVRIVRESRGRREGKIAAVAGGGGSKRF